MNAIDPDRRCAKLRWKSYGHDRDDPARLLQVLNRSEVVFTCLETACSFGVDDDVAAPERCCSEARVCFTALRRPRPANA